MSEPRFGENFEPDPTNRMDVLHEQDNLPEYVKFVRSEIREPLREVIETEGWPECPNNIKSVDDFFGAARGVVSEYWQDLVGDKIINKCQEWSQKIPNTEENQNLIKTLIDKDRFESMFEIYRFGVLESLRKVNPGAWRTLVLVSSERQLANLALMRHWTKKLPPATFKNMDIKKEELGLMLDAAGILGKYVDQAYVKQIELADQPGGQSETKLVDTAGAEFIYDIHRTGTEKELKTYSEVLPFELPKITQRLSALSSRTERLLAAGKLPNTYTGLPKYLKQLSLACGSDETNPQELEKIWDALEEESGNLMENGCPIMFVPQGGDTSATGAAGKVDVELRFGLQTSETKRAQKLFGNFLSEVNKANNHYREAMGELPKSPKVFLNIQPLAFGPNLYGPTRGESSPDKIISYTNAVIDAVSVEELPLLERLGLINVDSDGGEYKLAAINDTVFHELGHRILPSDDKKVLKRIGGGNEADALEELKAETMAMKLLLKASETNPEIKESLSSQFLARLGTVLGYLKNKSDKSTDSQSYYLTGVAEFLTLMDSGSIVRQENGPYVINDAKKGIVSLAKLGDSIIEKFYVNEESNPKKVKAYVEQLSQQSKDHRIAALLNDLR